MGLKPSFGHESDSEDSEQLVNLGLTALREPDDSPHDGLSEDRMTSWDNSPNTTGRNAEQLDDPSDCPSEDEAYVVPLLRSTQCKRPAPSCNLCDHEIGRSVAKGKMNYLIILNNPVSVLPVGVR